MFEKVEAQIQNLLKKSVERYLKENSSGYSESSPTDNVLKSSQKQLSEFLQTLSLEIPKEKDFGDLSCTIALKLSRLLRKNPYDIASGIIRALDAVMVEAGTRNLIARVELKGAGFINLFLKDEVFYDLLKTVHAEGKKFGFQETKKGQRLLLEFVSANPTGPLSVAHARQAAVGDSLANILSSVGYRVTREYYLNDEGNQINILGNSVLLRYKQFFDPSVEFPENYYQGQYIIDLARELFDNEKTRAHIQKLEDKAREDFFIDYGVRKILDVIKKELKDFGVVFDVWYSQKTLSEKIESVLSYLRKKGFIFESEGAVWFKSTAFGDDKDRVVRKSDGSYTYLAPDIAYHEDKFKRGFDKIINIWGPDHHGYIPRMKAAVQALGKDALSLDVIIVQLATLFRQGEPVPMSTRKGQYVTLREVLTEVGLDASRFFFLMRKTDSHLDFDLELAKKQTSENPVYYIQYAHARIAGILAGSKMNKFNDKKINFSLLKEPQERELMRTILEFPYCLGMCANQLDPYNLTIYLQSLSAAFHRFYDLHKVLSEDESLTQARLFLILSVKIVLANGLGMMGVSAPEHM